MPGKLGMICDGNMVSQVKATGQAAAAGIQSGMIISKINDEDVFNDGTHDISHIIQNSNKESMKITFTIFSKSANNQKKVESMYGIISYQDQRGFFATTIHDESHKNETWTQVSHNGSHVMFQTEDQGKTWDAIMETGTDNIIKEIKNKTYLLEHSLKNQNKISEEGRPS